MNYQDSGEPLDTSGTLCKLPLWKADRLFVSDIYFSRSARSLREYLWKNFKEWHRHIRNIGVPVKVLIEGDFARRCYNPRRIDVVCVYNSADVLSREGAEERIIDLCSPTNAEKYDCSVREEKMSVNVNDEELYNKALGWFGYDPGEKAPIFEFSFLKNGVF
jgi:hypothetical protein